jgi:hypothetical protein
MSTRPLRRLGAAAVLAVGLLVASATPAPASATHVEISPSSTLIIHAPTTSTVMDNTHLTGHATSNVCAPNSSPPDHIPVALDSSGGGTIGAHSSPWRDFVFGTSTFKMRMNIVSGTMTFSPSGVIVGLTFTFEYRNCASTTLLCRTNNISITLTGANPTGTHHPTASTTLPVSGASTPITVPVIPACNPLIRPMIVNNEVVASLGLHFTDSSA